MHLHEILEITFGAIVAICNLFGIGLGTHHLIKKQKSKPISQKKINKLNKKKEKLRQEFEKKGVA